MTRVEKRHNGVPNAGEEFTAPRDAAGGALSDIAIIGFSGRFPGAGTPAALWEKVIRGEETISTFTEDEVREAGVDPARHGGHFVPAWGVLDRIDQFDAAFFNLSPREASLMDPQHRLFLECAWEALEVAGYDPITYRGAIGVYGGVGETMYGNMAQSDAESGDELSGSIALRPDYLTTQVSYRMNLRGPSVTVQTACSTSLVAVHLACQSILNGECELALAGGVSILVPQPPGYVYQEGGVFSPDGHCRPFDSLGQGVVSGSGVGIVVLKRLAEALKDGDSIRAVIRGSAVNNDGSRKVGFTAPSIEGQAQVVSEALAVADIDPATVQYIEAHGTGTPLGDPIEVAALGEVYRSLTPRSCALGSIKSNVGHLDTAAGVTGLIKAVMALEHRVLPPTVHFATPNPRIDWARTPFYVPTTATPWSRLPGGNPRRAAVSSFGIGGTNAHVVLEEAPPERPSVPARKHQLLVLSAKSPGALKQASSNLADYLEQHPETALADVSYTLQTGRAVHAHRSAVVAGDVAEAVAAMKDEGTARRASVAKRPRSIAFLFAGQGPQYVGMGSELYATEPTFRAAIDQCASKLKPLLGMDLRKILYPGPEIDEAARAAAGMERLDVSLPALFAVQYALAQLLDEWGIEPSVMLGHSLGEYAAACLAGVFSLEDALRLVSLRGQLILSVPEGAMLAVPLDEASLATRLAEPSAAGVSIAAVNGPALCVVSGPVEAIGQFEQGLASEGIDLHRVRITRAAHSAMLDPILPSFRTALEHVHLQPPQRAFLSNLTGTWITAREATDPDYWVRHLREPVRFAEGVAELLKDPGRLYLEIGPGRTLGTLVRQQAAASGASPDLILPTLRQAKEAAEDGSFLLQAVGALWSAGLTVNWEGMHAHGGASRRIPLPTYPFERERYWLEPETKRTGSPATTSGKKPNPVDWLYRPSWKRVALTNPTPPPNQSKNSWLVFRDRSGVAAGVGAALRVAGHHVSWVERGDPGCDFEQVESDRWRIDPAVPGHYDALMAALQSREPLPDHVIHSWTIDDLDGLRHWPDPLARYEACQELGLYSLIFLGQSLETQFPLRRANLYVISSGVQEVTGEELLEPAKATVLAPCTVLRQEYPHLTCRHIDVICGEGSPSSQLLLQLTNEVMDDNGDRVVAYRGLYRWVREFEPVRLAPTSPEPLRLRQNGVYLITGGLGLVGLKIAEKLARTIQPKLALLGRKGLPARSEWNQWVTAHDENDSVTQGIKAVQALEAYGAEVLICPADVGDRSQMEAVLQAMDEQWGVLHGVVHAAGMAGVEGLTSIRNIGLEELRQQAWPKVQGTFVLADLLSGRELDFCVLTSSLASILGGINFTGYAAANLFLDAFAHAHRRTGVHWWTSINWDIWKPAAGTATPAQTTLDEFYFSGDEGANVLDYALALMPEPQLVISTGDLQQRIDQWVQLESLEEESPPVPKPSPTTVQSRAHLTAAYAAPANEVEQTIAGVWEELLGFSPIGRHDNFLELGGHSLMGLRMLTRLRKTYHMSLPIELIFNAPTVAQLAAAIVTGGEERPAEVAPLLPRDRKDQAPLSFAQEDIWAGCQQAAKPAVAIMPLARRMVGTLDVPALAETIGEIVRRHEILRTTFPLIDGQPVQLIAPPSAGPYPLRVLQLTDLDEDVSQTEFVRLTKEEFTRPFDFACEPPFRALLLQTGAAEHVLLLTFHAMALDGWSVHVLDHELSAHYTAFSQGEPAPLPPLTVQYADYAAWQREHLGPDALKAKVERCMARIAGVSQLNLPTETPPPSEQSYSAGFTRFHLPQDFLRELHRVCRQENVTLYMLLLAAFKVLLHRYSGQTDLVVDTPTAGRIRSELEPLIGAFANTLLLRTDLSGDPAFRTVLGRVRETTVETFAHQEVRFNWVLDRLQAEGRAPDLSWLAAFSMQNTGGAFPAPLRFPGLVVEPVRATHGITHVTLSLIMEEAPDGFYGSLRYRADLLGESYVQAMARDFGTLLQQAMSNLDRPLSKLPLFADIDEEHQRTVTSWMSYQPLVLGDVQYMNKQMSGVSGGEATMRGATTAGAAS